MEYQLLVQGALDADQISESLDFREDGRGKRTIALSGGSIRESSMLARVAGGAEPWDQWWQSFLRGAVVSTSSGRPQEVRAIDLFASVGGLSLGIREAARALGIRITHSLAADLDADALATYQRNFLPTAIANRSVTELVDYRLVGRGTKAELLQNPVLHEEARQLQKIDLVVGGPPCQGHSSLNNHTRGDDQRNDLYLAVPTMAIALNASTVVIENVPRVVHDRQQVVATSQRILESAGYFVTAGVLSAAEFGWPQTRSRHFLVASRVRRPMDLARLAETQRRESRGLWWAIGDLAASVEPDSLMSSVPKLSVDNIQRINWLFENDAYELPNHVRPDCHKDGHTYPSVYGRLQRELPAPTITTGFQTPGRGRYIHPTERRVLTCREAARIQGFPDSFEFAAQNGALTRAQLHKWIGDAVPSILGYVVGLAALETLL